MGLRVAKFGGTSLASAKEYRKVKQIILSDKRRRYVVPSAPGKQCSTDDKITDLLYKCHELICSGLDYDHVFQIIRTRYQTITADLGLDLDIGRYLDEVYNQMTKEERPDYTASRGEYLNGIILANYLDFDFVDAAEIIRFNDQGYLDLTRTEGLVKERLEKHQYAVIPGFYGAMPNGEIQTFARGGSDITGAIVARSVNAEVYENWTDVSGFFMADPRILKILS